MLSVLVGFLLFPFDLDTGGCVPVLLPVSTRSGSGVDTSSSTFIAVEIRNKELIALLVQAQDREEDEASGKVLVLERSWNLLTLGP